MTMTTPLGGMRGTLLLINLVQLVMSDYCLSLDRIARERYEEKLGLLRLKVNDDPYASWNADSFIDDMTLWPPVEFGHFFCYFVERSGVYTKRELMQWKSLEAYNYFQSGHVHTVKLWKCNNDSSIAKAMVNPGQSTPDKAHEAWIALKKDGEVITAQCTCMAG